MSHRKAALDRRWFGRTTEQLARGAPDEVARQERYLELKSSGGGDQSG